MPQERTTLRRLAVAGAASTSALAASGLAGPMVQEADAEVIQYATNFVIPATNDGLYINVETQATGTTPSGAPGWDINPWSSSGLAFFSPNAPAGGAYMPYPGSGTNYAGNLDPGTVVGAAETFGTSDFVTFGASAGEWKLNATNYFGFRFVGGDSQLRYGWGKMVVGSSALNRTITELAYENTPGASITVGAAAIPEPSQLAMLAVGAVGLLGWRRLRRTA